MRVLVLAGNIDRPEAAIFAGLAQRGNYLRLIGEPSPEHTATLERAGIPITRFAFRNRFDVKGMRLVRSIVQAERFDLVYAVSNRALSSAVIGLLGVEIPIVAYRGTVGHISKLDPSSWFTYLNPKVRKILCVSLAVEEYLAAVGISTSRITTVYKGHMPEWYTAGESPRREAFGIPEDAFVIGCTAAMRAVKGIDDLLDAAALLLKQIPSLHVLLIGPIKDPHIEKKIAAFPDQSRIHLTGFRSDATALAPLFDVVIMASKSREGFPKAVVEAMAQGIPAIVTAVGGMPELVDNGAAGLMVAPNNPSSIAAAISQLFSDPDLRNRIGVVGQQRIATTFHVHKTIERMNSEFSSLVNLR
jgi:glycosyltransferase involved in cell wall biosynthesis